MRTPGLKLVSGLVILLDLSVRILTVRTRGRVQGCTYSNLWKLKIDTTVSAWRIQKRINKLTPATASNLQSRRFHLRPCRFGCLCPFRGSGQMSFLFTCSRLSVRLDQQNIQQPDTRLKRRLIRLTAGDTTQSCSRGST